MLDLWSEKLLATPYYTFTINPTPSTATVTINGVNTKTVTVEEGTTITWSVSASGYTSQSGSLTLTANTTKNITLVSSLKYACYTYTYNGVPYYYYAKAPLGSDMIQYGHNSGDQRKQATSSSQLKQLTDVITGKIIKWSSVKETEATIVDALGITQTNPRYKAGDLSS